MKELFEIFIASAKVGALTFGGGYAMLPILQREIVENKGWNSAEFAGKIYLAFTEEEQRSSKSDRLIFLRPVIISQSYRALIKLWLMELLEEHRNI